MELKCTASLITSWRLLVVLWALSYGLAPVVRYATEVFSNQVRFSPDTLSFGVLREAWESAHG
eukprot:2401938-Pyramimonas_sp.AAC.1